MILAYLVLKALTEGSPRMGFVRPSRALCTNWPHAADIRTRMDGTGEARSATTGLSIRKCSPCRAVSPFGGGEAFAYEHSPGPGVAGLLHHARS